MKWATRRHCHVDRAACAWLIRRFVDMRGVELGHRHGGCSFESFLRHYDLDEPALRDLGRIVHEADIGDDLYDVPEAPGLDVVVRGASLVARDDDELLALTGPLFDGLYEFFRRTHLHETSS